MLSIIIPTLNEEKCLPKLLSSIKEQNFKKKHEIIVSDGNSDDKTRQIAIEAGCQVVNDKLRHPAQQRNKGAEKARGDVLLFLDADADFPPNFLEKSYQEFKNRQLSVASFYLRFDSKKKVYRLYDFAYRLLCCLGQYLRPLAVGAAIMSDKEAHNKVQGFDRQILVGEDHDYARRIKKIGRFRMIKSTYFYFSPRRWEKEGHRTSLKKLFKMAAYITFKGPIKKKIVNYDFGDF